MSGCEGDTDSTAQGWAVLRAKVSQLKWAVEFGNLALLQMPGGYGGLSKIPACARQRQASGLA